MPVVTIRARSLVSASASRTGQVATTLQSWIGAFPMIKHYAERAWKLALTVGPLVAVALALAAGTKWH